MQVEYKTSCITNAGFRSVDVIAIVEKIIDIIDVDGNGNSGYASKRQNYSVASVCRNEIGKVKNLSSVTVIS